MQEVVCPAAIAKSCTAFGPILIWRFAATTFLHSLLVATVTYTTACPLPPSPFHLQFLDPPPPPLLPPPHSSSSFPHSSYYHNLPTCEWEPSPNRYLHYPPLRRILPTRGTCHLLMDEKWVSNHHWWGSGELCFQYFRRHHHCQCPEQWCRRVQVYSCNHLQSTASPQRIVWCHQGHHHKWVLYSFTNVWL